ncbi:MAG: DUF349 domain-containing protein [Bacteroides sp.]|nr:DUF349 domain-containing protein [Bacteroides sp.]MCM1414064.1 DUF349 domain-containing protein [Bacteroides sp.]MCM1472337.1 DUF349 domain-containing protein [Bacteroides sp.]
MELLNNEAANLPEEMASPLTDSPACEDAATTEPQIVETPVTIESLLDTLREIASRPGDQINIDEVGRIKQQFYHLKNLELAQATVAREEGSDVELPTESESEATFKALMADIKEHRATYRAEVEAREAANLERKKAIIDEIRRISADTDNVNLHHQSVKDLQAQFKEIGDVPQQFATETWKTYQDAVETFYDQWKVNKELRDYDFKKNLSEKQLLIDQAQKLIDEPDVVTAFRRLQELHDKWREIGPVAKDLREEIWAKFKDISAEINKRYQTFFEERKQREQQNEAAKTELCQRIEAIDTTLLKTYADWNNATNQIMEAQEAWKKLGYASRKTNNALFSRFRKCCDDFFAAKSAFFTGLKENLSANLEAKIKLCEEAEALKESTEWKKTADKLVELQKKWKSIGAVPKKQSDQVWGRFTAACDYFFGRKKETESSTRKTEQANLAAKRAVLAELTELNSPEATTERTAAINRINELRATWQNTGHVPFREKDKLHDAYREVVRQLFDKYDIHQNKARQASFEANISEIGSDHTRLNRERERLMRAYDSRRNELANYERNLGFFNAKSKSGNSMLRDIQHNIERLKKEIDELQAKIVLVESKL